MFLKEAGEYVDPVLLAVAGEVHAGGGWVSSWDDEGYVYLLRCRGGFWRRLWLSGDVLMVYDNYETVHWRVVGRFSVSDPGFLGELVRLLERV